MDTKPFWQSKTIWVNAIALAGLIVESTAGTNLLNPETQVGLLAVVNLLLRVATRSGVGLS